MWVDFKVTTWERVEIPEELEEKFLKLIKSGEISSAEDMFQYDENLDCRKLADCDEQMTPEENDGCSTIEVYENSSPIWGNGKY